MEIKVVKDLLNCTRDQLEKDIGETRALFLYGSYACQDLDKEVSKFRRLHGIKGLLDKKPDFIAVVSDLEKSIKQLGENRKWDDRTVQNLLNLRRDTPHYFNLKTKEKHLIRLKGKEEDADIPFKVGIINEEGFFAEPNKDNIYLPSRLSKYNNKVSVDQDLEESVRNYMSKVQDYFIGLTLKILPRRFSGEKFMKLYLQSTYLAEAYRLFDIIGAKHRKILKSKVYDLHEEKVFRMRDKLEEILVEKVLGREDVTLVRERDSFYKSKFINEDRSNNIRTLFQFMRFNFVSLGITLYKNRITNAAGGGNNLAYIGRKIGILQ